MYWFGLQFVELIGNWGLYGVQEQYFITWNGMLLKK